MLFRTTIIFFYTTAIFFCATIIFFYTANVFLYTAKVRLNALILLYFDPKSSIFLPDYLKHTGNDTIGNKRYD